GFGNNIDQNTPPSSVHDCDPVAPAAPLNAPQPHVASSTGRDIHYTYDVLGRVNSTAFGKIVVSRLKYDGASRPIELWHASTGALTFAYDAAGRLVSRENGLAGFKVSYTRDHTGRVIGIQESAKSGGRVHDITLQYDQGQYGKGRLTSIFDAHTGEQYEFDAAGNSVATTFVRDHRHYKFKYGYSDHRL